MDALRVDLTKGRVEKFAISKEDEELYIGGKGVASKLLFNIPPRTDPLSPANAIVFAIGPLSGLRFPGSSRMTCVFKSPLTDAYGESQCGGWIAREFRKAGIFVLCITGKAPKPSYILVQNDSAEILDASDLWGCDAFETERELRKAHGGEVAVIGQAGENLVRFACITHRKGRQFGRCGAGAVMGSKNLKAVVVVGDGDIEVAKPDRLEEFRRWLVEESREKLQSLTRYGTPGILSLVNEAVALPTRYWQKGSFEGAEMISAEALLKFKKRNSSCYGCSVACGTVVEADGVEVEGPEYETLYALGSLCENADVRSIIRAAELCDRYGMDTITTGNVIAYLMACSERGETDVSVNFGDGEAIVELVRKIAFREGIGNVLAEGVRRAAGIMKTSVEPVHSRGLEPAGYDPRSLYGMALAYAVSQRGACHMRSCAYRPNLVGAIDRFSPEGQAKLVKELEDLYCVVDSLVLCRFLSLPIIGPLQWEQIAELYEIVTGRRRSVESLQQAGERIWVLARKFNERENAAEDSLPNVFFNIPIDVYGKKAVVERGAFEKMLYEYYRLRRLE